MVQVSHRAAGDNVHKRGLARCLQADQRQLHLLLPEERLEPLCSRVNTAGQHSEIRPEDCPGKTARAPAMRLKNAEMAAMGRNKMTNLQ